MLITHHIAQTDQKRDLRSVTKIWTYRSLNLGYIASQTSVRTAAYYTIRS